MRPRPKVGLRYFLHFWDLHPTNCHPGQRPGPPRAQRRVSAENATTAALKVRVAGVDVSFPTPVLIAAAAMVKGKADKGKAKGPPMTEEERLVQAEMEALKVRDRGSGFRVSGVECGM